MLSTEIAGFLVAITLISPTIVLPTFVTQLGGSALMVGLASTCQSAGWFLPQLLGASISAGKPRMLPYILRPLYAGRVSLLVLAGVVLVAGGDRPALLLATLYATIVVFYVTDGVSTVPWYELISRIIPADRRGRMFGLAQVAGGLGAMAAGAAIAGLLARPEVPFPSNYGVLFAIAGVVFLLNVIPFRLVLEPEYGPGALREAPRESIGQFASMLLPILRRDHNFVRLVVVRLLFGSLLGTFSFYVLFAERHFSLGPERLGLFISAQVFGNLVGGLAVGWAADHLGTKSVIRAAALAGGSVPVLAALMLAFGVLSTDAILYASVLLFVLIGMANSTNLSGFMNYIMESAPQESRTTYLGLFNTVAGVLLVVPPLAGWLLESTSFGALFAVSIGFGAACLLLTGGLRKPQRR